MPDLTSIESTLLENLALIDTLGGEIARRHGLRGDDVDDFRSWVRLRLVENDYRALRQFRGESSIEAYLSVVVAMLARDYRNHRWGRWRSSSEARRRGPLAVRLEMLVRRDGYPLRHAGELLRTAGETESSDRQLAELLAELPARGPIRPIEVGDAPLAEIAGAGTPSGSSDHDDARRRVHAELETALAALPVEDRTIVRMRFWVGASIAEISRGLGLDQKPLYRRIERLLARLRTRLAAAGVDREQLNDLLNEDALA